MNIAAPEPTPQRNTPALTGPELQSLREACHLSRDELGDLVGVQARTIKHWENGRAAVPQDVADRLGTLDDRLSHDAHTQARQVRAKTHPGMMPDGSGVALVAHAGNPTNLVRAARLRLALQMTQPAQDIAEAPRVYLVTFDEDLFNAWGGNNPTEYRKEGAWNTWAAQHRATLPR